MIDRVCLGVVVALVGVVSIANIAQPDRPTVSETEKRPLAEMPVFSVGSLASGKYFSDISLFVSDTFIARDRLVTVSKKIDSLRGANYSLGEDDFVILNPTGNGTAEDGDDDLFDKLAAALDKLGKQDPVPDDTVPPDNATPDDGESAPGADDGERETVLADGSISEIVKTGEAGKIESLSVSKESLKLTVGAGSTLKATVTSSGGATVVWSTSDENVVKLGMNPKGGVDVKTMGAGKCVVTCKSGGLEAKCEIDVREINSVTENPGNENADFLADGLFIYGDAVYTQGAYSYNNAKAYLDTALYYKNLFGANTRVSVVIAPVSSMVIDNPAITSQIPDQSAIMQNMASICDPSVNFVDTYSKMYEHRDEYLFFKTDHHWTARGAYYAYAAFAESVGFEPTPLDEFDYVLKNEDYHGSMYDYTLDERVKAFSDSVEAFIPRKEHTMTITTRQGTTETYNSSVVSFNNTYVAFIAGDNPYTVINVPDNPQDRSVLVLKDSFGNGFVPFLAEHYGNIFVVDTRYSSFNIYDQLADYGITDIIFVNNIQAANSPAWSRMYLSAVGVE